MKRLHILATLALAGVATSAASAQNLIPGHTGSITFPGGDSVLRPGSGWDAGSTPSDVLRLIDGVFAPESQQWNNGSYWWDETQTASPFQTTLGLNGSFTFNRLVLQADDNDDYVIEYWTGSAWQNVFTAAATGGYGLTTRDSGTLAAFTTNGFRLTAINGDQYYAMSEFQAFAAGVPEPASWALMLGGFGLVGGAMRSRRTAAVTFA